MKKFAILAGLVALALLLGMAGTAVRSNDAQAKPEDVLAFSPNVCIALTTGVLEGDWDNDGGDYDADDEALGKTICAGAINTVGGLNTLARILDADVIATAGVSAEPWTLCGNGLDDDVDPLDDSVIDDGCADPAGVNDPALYQDLNDLSGSQLGDYSTNVAGETNGKLWVLTFVTNDGAVTFEADEGVWLHGLTSATNCIGPSPGDDEDCDGDGVKGDKVVVEQLLGNNVADLGDAELVATQGGVDVIYDYVVVGIPDEGGDLTFLTDGIVQEDAEKCADTPHLTPLDSSVFTDGAAEPEKNGLLTTVVDDDDTALAGIFVDWSSDDTDVADLNKPKTITWDFGDKGIFASNLFCGDGVGTATITAGVDTDYVAGAELDTDVDVTVIGVPDDMALTASPLAITCDGVNSSTVTAALVDDKGNKVVDGTDVRFEVVALGIADPIEGTTAGGAAESKITPLSGVSAGVVVIVRALDAAGETALERNIRIDCALPVAPPVAPPPVSPTGPTVVPPGTGDGGYLP